MAEKMTQETKTTMERHAQTVLVFIITGLLAWVGVNLINQGQAIVRIEEQMRVMHQEIQMLRGQLNNQYTHRDAERDLNVLRTRLDEHHTRLERLEGVGRGGR